MSHLIQIAAQEIGITEIPGSDSHPRILAYAQAIGFDSWYHNDDTPWCSLFLNWAAHEAGLERSEDGRAASWGQIGQATERPEPGDIALVVPSPGDERITHVGIYLGYAYDQERIYLLGGNQSNQVNISGFRTETVVGFRRLGPIAGPTLAEAHTTLRKGDSGTAVVELQDALKLAGYDAGTSDGIFGNMTREALISLQQSTDELEANGEFDLVTREYLSQVLADKGLA